jgi:twinkle protein
MRDGNVLADKGAAALDRRIIPENFDWREYDVAPERTKVLPASSFAAALVEQLLGDKRQAGVLWPWDKANDLGLRFRPQEVTVLAGINGHRKSLVAGQIALHLMRQGERCLIASFEMAPHKTLERMVRQAAGSGEPSLRYVRAWAAWSDGRLWLYDHLGQCDARRVLAVARYACTELAVRHVFIDSLMKVTRSVDDYNEQKRFVADLCALALACDAHVYLVAHARKGRQEEDALDKFDIKGAGEIIDQAHNAVLIQKNLKSKDAGDCDQFVTVAKQRDGAFEGTLGLWFDPAALTLGERPGGRWPHIEVLA